MCRYKRGAGICIFSPPPPPISLLVDEEAEIAAHTHTNTRKERKGILSWDWDEFLMVIRSLSLCVPNPSLPVFKGPQGDKGKIEYNVAGARLWERQSCCCCFQSLCSNMLLKGHSIEGELEIRKSHPHISILCVAHGKRVCGRTSCRDGERFISLSLARAQNNRDTSSFGINNSGLSPRPTTITGMAHTWAVSK